MHLRTAQEEREGRGDTFLLNHTFQHIFDFRESSKKEYV